jgi:hypothetical protein
VCIDGFHALAKLLVDYLTDAIRPCRRRQRDWQVIERSTGATDTRSKPSTACLAKTVPVVSLRRAPAGAVQWLTPRLSGSRNRGRQWGLCMARIRREQGRSYRPSLSSSANRALPSGFGVSSRSLDCSREEERSRGELPRSTSVTADTRSRREVVRAVERAVSHSVRALFRSCLFRGRGQCVLLSSYLS